MNKYLKSITQTRTKELNLCLAKKEISKLDQNKIIQIAKELLNNTFSFNKRWDMERCTKKIKLHDFSFYSNPTSDEEWLFMLNRFDWISYLCLASTLTSNKSYAIMAKYFIMKWIAEHPKIEPDSTTRTLDTGIRIINILNALPYLEARQLLSEHDYSIIADSLLNQIKYLRTNYIPRYKTSNWGSIQIAAILMSLPWLEPNLSTNSTFLWAKKELKFQLQAQILDDGLHWEQSFMYHVEVLNYLQYLLYFKQYFGFDLDINIERPISSMTKALEFMLTSDKKLELFGDSDSVATSDVFNRSALLLHNSEYKSLADNKLDFETMYIMGFNKNRKFREIVSTSIKQLSFYGQDSGIITIRNSWENNANRLFFTNGSLGSGHGHADNMHLSVDINGTACLIDSGRYTYQENNPLRAQLKSMQAHNVIVLDNNPGSVPLGSWDYQQFIKPLKNYFKEDANLHYLESSLITQKPMSIWTRKILMLDEGCVIIFDELNSSGIHSYQQYFHIPNYPNSKLDKNKVQILDNYLQLSKKAEKIDLTPTQISPAYNLLTSANLITAQGKFKDSENLTTILSPKTIKVTNTPIMQGRKQLPNQVAEGFEIKTKHAIYLIAVLHSEIFTGSKILKIKNCYFHAQAVAIKISNETTKYYYLKS